MKSINSFLPPGVSGMKPATDCLLLLMFRHGLRASEACGLELPQVDIESRVLLVARPSGNARSGAQS